LQFAFFKYGEGEVV